MKIHEYRRIFLQLPPPPPLLAIPDVFGPVFLADLQSYGWMSMRNARQATTYRRSWPGTWNSRVLATQILH
jgi:hypothetical protein